MADEQPSAGAEDIERKATNAAQLAKKWNAEIAASTKAQAKWVERCKKIERIYNDERDVSSGRQRRFNILWSNVETLRPACYMNTPKAKAVRRYRDRDPVARLTSMLLERCLETSCELYDFDHHMDQAVRDRLLVGRGQAWAFYVPEEAGQGDNAVMAYESVVVEYVPWQDFLHSVTRNWAENRWVARRFYKTRDELKEWMGQLGLDGDPRLVTMDVSAEGERTDDGLKDQRSKAMVWEVWDKPSQRVIYVAPGSGDNAILGMIAPPTRFRDFWPCPRPMLATTTSKSLIPTPDYALYQDQAEELNRITERIGVLQKAMKVAGVYASESAELASLIESGDNRMIPVQNWAMFSEGGGAKSRIEWFPTEQVAIVLKALYEMRDQAKQTLYEVSGLGDILRGETDPNETATAQSIKSKWGSMRVRRLQKDVMRFAADIMRLKAEVIAGQFSFQSIASMAGLDEELLAKYIPLPPMPQPPDEPGEGPEPPEAPEPNEAPQGGPPMGAQPGQPGQPQQDPQAAMIAKMQAQAQYQAAVQQWQMQKAQAIQQFLAQVQKLLKDETARSFRIEVETDSTLEPDQQEEKQTAVEFTTAMTQFMEAAAPMAAAGPEAAKMVGEILLFAVRRFGNVDQLEQAVEQAVEAASKPRPPQPDPDMVKAQTVQQTMQVKAKIDAAKADADIQHKQQSQQLDAMMQQQQMAMEWKQTMAEIQSMWIKLNAEMQAKKQQAAVDQQITLDNAAVQREAAAMNGADND